MRRLLIAAVLLVAGCGAPPTASPVIVPTQTPAAAADPTPTVSPTLVRVPPQPTPRDTTPVVVHIVAAVDDLQKILMLGGDPAPWILAEATWLTNAENGFVVVGQTLDDYTSAIKVALQALADDDDPIPAAEAIVALRPALAALAPEAVGTPPPTPEPVKPITAKGKGRLNTKPFYVPGGDYTATIAGTGDGNVMADLRLRDQSDWILLFNELAYGKFKYETIIYGVVAGSYYFDMNVDGPWTITLTPYR